MNALEENKKPLKNLLNTSWEIWDFLKKAGLDVKNYDLHIAEELCKGLGILCSNLISAYFSICMVLKDQ